MAALTIRNLDEDVKRRLRIRAAENGRSMEAEAREILRAALRERLTPPTRGFGTRAAAIFAEAGGAELEIPPRTDMPREIDVGE